VARYVAQVRGRAQPAEVDIEPLGDGRFALTLGGERHEVDALRLGHGAVSLLVDGESFSVEFDESGDEVAVQVGSQVTRIDVADERRLRMRSARAGFAAEGRQVVSAPMPGKLVKILVKAGDRVEEGQGLVVVEAMKMENELKSPKAGKVLEVFAAEGMPVEQGAKLVAVE
jgi:biotin carboxyl carrier protein